MAPGDRVLELPQFVWILKIVQAVLAVILLGLTAYQVTFASWSGDGLALWASIFSILTLVYYFVAIHSAPQIYNWIALLTLEAFNVLWWLVSWALYAALLGGSISYGDSYDYYYYWYKRNLHKRATTTLETYGNTIYTTLAFALIEWLLFVVTLVFIVLAVVKHTRRTGTGLSQPAVKPREEVQMESVPHQTV